MDAMAGVETQALQDGGAVFEVDTCNAGRGGVIALFAAGRGGNPRRHGGLIASLAARGCTVLAPHFEPLASPVPSADELRARVRRMERTLAAFAGPDNAAAGIGHSVGAATVLMLAGAEAWTLARERLAPGSTRFKCLVLLAPATDFFQAPGALAGVTAPLVLWAGGRDVVAPPEKVLVLKQDAGADVRVFIEDDAGHFTFMDEPPPNSVEPHPDRAGFLGGMADEICRIVLG